METWLEVKPVTRWRAHRIEQPCPPAGGWDSTMVTLCCAQGESPTSHLLHGLWAASPLHLPALPVPHPQIALFVPPRRQEVAMEGDRSSVSCCVGPHWVLVVWVKDGGQRMDRDARQSLEEGKGRKGMEEQS